MSSVEFGPFRFDPTEGLWRGETEVPLPPRALGVLAALVAHPGTVVSKQALLDASWPDTAVTEASLLEVIRVLRGALGDDRQQPVYIQTVHRRGYRFIAEVKSSKGAKVTKAATGSDDAHLEPWRPLIVAAAASIVAMIGVSIVFAVFGQRPLSNRPTMRFTIPLPENTAIDPLRGSLAVSSDGTRMVYVAMQAGRSRLLLRTIDRDEPDVLDGSDGAADPFFSPDGAWIGFFSQGSLKKIRVDGGRPVVICAARAGAGAAWGRDGTIIFGGGPGGGLARVSADGGDPVVLAAPTAGSRELSFGWPDILPDGRAVIFTAISPADSYVAALDLSTGTRHTLVDAAAFGRYSPTGHLVFERRGRLEAAPFSPGQWRLAAPPRPILRGIATAAAAATLGGPRFAFSRSGSLIYVPGASSGVDERLHWLDVRGGLEAVPLPAVAIGGADLAPDLNQLALAVEGDRGTDLWIGDLSRGALSRLTLDGRSVSPAWRPDGLEIAFAFSKAGPFNLFLRPAGGGGVPQLLLESPWNQLPTSWSPDGRLLAFTEFHPHTGADVWVLDVTTRQRRLLARTLFDETHARFSPDGRWIAYMTNEAGRWDVFVRPVDADAPRVQVSTGDGGAWPCWSIDGRTIYYSAGGRAAAVAFRASPTLSVSAPVMLAGRDDLQPAGGRAGADRVLVRQGGAATARREVRLVLEWFTELTRLLRSPA